MVGVHGYTETLRGYKGEDVLIPCIPMIPNDMPFDFKRLQFPVQLAFAMSVNKSQGQSLSVCGINLENPCFFTWTIVCCMFPCWKTINITYFRSRKQD